MASINSMYELEFAGNRIDTMPNVDVTYYNFIDLPERNMSVHKIARRNLSVLTSAEYSQKLITVWLNICGGGRQETEKSISDLKGVLQQVNGSLRVLQAHRAVEYTATLQSFEIEWDRTRAFCEIGFLATDPIGRAVDPLSLFSITGVTGQTASATFTVDGSFNAEPLITILLANVTGGTGEINLLNARTSQGVTLSETFQAGDIITVDAQNYQIELNGISIDYQGLFPTFPPGQQSFSYSDTFNSRTVDVTATYKPRHT